MSTFTNTQTIEVIGLDMMCFKVRHDDLEPVSSSYYEPAAWSDPRGAQMDVSEWQARRNAIRAMIEK